MRIVDKYLSSIYSKIFQNESIYTRDASTDVGLLLKPLEKIEGFNNLIKKIKESPNVTRADFFAELKIGSMFAEANLVKKIIIESNGKTPDFLLEKNGEEVFMEVKSKRLNRQHYIDQTVPNLSNSIKNTLDSGNRQLSNTVSNIIAIEISNFPFDIKVIKKGTLELLVGPSYRKVSAVFLFNTSMLLGRKIRLEKKWVINPNANNKLNKEFII